VRYAEPPYGVVLRAVRRRAGGGVKEYEVRGEG
jgi:hypothetical protein